MLTLLYTPGLLVSARALSAASAAFNRVWTARTRQEEAPMFGLVKVRTAVDRSMAHSRRLTNTWPGD